MICVSDFVSKSNNVRESSRKVSHNSALVAHSKIFVISTANFSRSYFSINPAFAKRFSGKISHFNAEGIITGNYIGTGFVKSPLFFQQGRFLFPFFRLQGHRSKKIIKRQPLFQLVIFISCIADRKIIFTEVFSLCLKILSPGRKTFFDSFNKSVQSFFVHAAGSQGTVNSFFPLAPSVQSYCFTFKIVKTGSHCNFILLQKSLLFFPGFASCKSVSTVGIISDFVKSFT